MINKPKTIIVNNTPDSDVLRSIIKILITINLILFAIIIYLVFKFRQKEQDKYKAKKLFEKLQIKKIEKLSKVEEFTKFCLKYFDSRYNIKANNLSELELILKNSYKLDKKLEIFKIFDHLNKSTYGKQRFMDKYTKHELKKIPKEASKIK